VELRYKRSVLPGTICDTCQIGEASQFVTLGYKRSALPVTICDTCQIGEASQFVASKKII